MSSIKYVTPWIGTRSYLYTYNIWKIYMYVWYCYICDVDVNMSFLLYELINDIFCSAEWKDFLIIVSIYIQLINTKKYKNTRYIEIIRWRLFLRWSKNGQGSICGRVRVSFGHAVLDVTNRTEFSNFHFFQKFTKFQSWTFRVLK